MGPLIDDAAVLAMEKSLAELRALGGSVLYGGERLRGENYPGGLYVKPCLVEARNEWPVVQRETFAPILYIIPYETLEEAIALQNAVPQGLTSAIFSTDVRETERFLAATGSDCGIANVNVGTSGAGLAGFRWGERPAEAVRVAAMPGVVHAAPDCDNQLLFRSSLGPGDQV